MVSGCFKGITFIVHFISIIMISCTLDHQAFDPRVWGPLVYGILVP